ncbi:hypothetical protein [Aurantimonas sp. 22II-16-19i]|uniref:hypothetical protein n=1 Tax=Aurantimonas sp. 22II-16-19i TaxID=1317114 RepID=UPI0009F7C4F6|nr:hypothetical protein [Aurantimonas sp. 22II-16-19i]ORE86666.1 hypothetical protein ATO4_25850 [Aurantimonas sp. 22II-16-19i]
MNLRKAASTLLPLATLLALGLSLPVTASNEESWQKMSAAAKKACIEASGLAKAKASEPVVFSDDVGYIALLVAGAYPQKPMKGQKGRMLWLFERSTGKASAEEAAGWRW